MIPKSSIASGSPAVIRFLSLILVVMSDALRLMLLTNTKAPHLHLVIAYEEGCRGIYYAALIAQD